MLKGAILLITAMSAAFLGLSSPAFGQLNAEERKGLDSALYMGNLTESDLRYEKKISGDPYRLPLNAFALDDPLGASERIFRLHLQGIGALSDALSAASLHAFEDPAPDTTGLPTLGPLPEEVPEELHEPLEILIGAINDSNKAVHRAISNLSPPEQRELIEGLPLWCAANKSVRFGFTKKSEVSQDRMLELLGKVDLVAIREASLRLSAVVENQIPALKQLSSTTHLEKSIRFVIQGYRVELSAEDDAIHTSRDTNLCISFGDRNRFSGRFGAGIGYSSVLLDFGNSNYYDVPDLSIGVGLLGVGLAYAVGSGDMFHGGSVCFGSGLAGVGAFSHVGGESSFRATALSEGFGSFGIGLLSDFGDRNTFNGELFCQGAARTQGVGWLVEQGSNDSFTAGGLSVIEGKNASVSCSQACSSGFGSDDDLLSGGVGMMTTSGANQGYAGGIRCQGVALLGGVASLCDMGTGATHSAVQEAQCYANHQSAAFLYNIGGYGAYTTKLGTSESCASDSSVSLLFDRGGHELFASKDARPGTAMNNGLALFLAAGSENTFQGEPALAVSDRGFSSIGLFCDLGAASSYTRPASFAPVRVEDNLAIFYQAQASVAESSTSGERQQEFVPGSEPSPGETRLAAEWARAKGSGPDSLRARDRLIAIGAPAAEFLFKESLGEWDPTAAIPLAQIVAQIGDDARKLLALDITSSNTVRQQNALRIACLAPGKGMDPAITAALAKPELRRLAAKAAGLCHVSEAVPQLMPLTMSKDPVLALYSLVSLGQIGDPSSAGTGAALLGSTQWPMRRAAVLLVSQFPQDAIAAATGLIASADEQQRRTGVQVLAAMKSPEGYRRIGKLLDAATPDIQIEALLALQGHVPDDVKGRVAEMQQSSNLLVRRLAEGIQVDR